ncbi:MAG: pentapeptide repeat-containing protein [Planctomycetota bacterium]
MTAPAPRLSAILPSGRAPVTPRGRLADGGEILPIEDLVEPWILSGARGAIRITGGPGSGKSVALAHLKAALGPQTDVVILDDAWMKAVEADAQRSLVIFTSSQKLRVGLLAEIELAPWGDDDAIEYLLAMHRGRCTSVMKRLLADVRRDAILKGSPEIFRIVLEALAASESIPDVTAALKRELEARFPDAATKEEILLLAWSLVVHSAEISGQGSAWKIPNWVLPLLRHRAVCLLLAAELVVTHLAARTEISPLSERLPRDLIQPVALLARSQPSVVAALRATACSPGPVKSQPNIASLLLAIDPDWRPSGLLKLSGAFLTGARWNGLNLGGAELIGAQLKSADLSNADLSAANLRRADLTRANLTGANLAAASAGEAIFDFANLSFARLDAVVMRHAHLHGAILRSASLAGAALVESDFEDADLADANLARASLRRARFEGANLRGASLAGAIAPDTIFNTARLAGALFHRAQLQRCDFEGVELQAPDFSSADLTGAFFTDSTLPRAQFRGAILAEAGLAGIEWERADLREVDFKNASFHLGSSRSGLVNSPLASEGTRTGFYTDDSAEQDFKAPEEIRKANLRGADLRLAKVLETDWYLVDLRDAFYSPEQGEHFKRCRAILADRAK